MHIPHFHLHKGPKGVRTISYEQLLSEDDSYASEKLSEDHVTEVHFVTDKDEDSNASGESRGSMELLENCFSLLHAQDDTSKFVSLTMLAKLLNDHPNLIFKCWERMDMKFLDRLLLSTHYEYVDLGVSILLAFCSEEAILRSYEVKKRVSTLLQCCLKHYDLCIPVICTLSSNPKSAKYLLYYTSFIINEFPFEQAFEILSNALYALDNVQTYMRPIFQGIDKRRGWKLDCTFSFFSDLFSRFPVQSWYSEAIRANLQPLMDAVVERFITDKNLSSATVILSNLLKAAGPASIMPNDGFMILVIGRCSAEIRGSLGMLVKAVGQKGKHGTVSYTVCECYEVLGLLIRYLCENCDVLAQRIEPDKFFQLQRSLTELFSDTMDFLRDAWDNNKNRDNLASHVTVISAVATLCLWLTEDDSQYAQASGLMDIFVYLWRHSWSNGIDYAKWISVALPSMLSNKVFFKAFKDFDAWKVVYDDFIKCNDDLKGDKSFNDYILSTNEEDGEDERLAQAIQDFHILIQLNSLVPQSIWDDDIWQEPYWKNLLESNF
ncbi:Neurochondrin-domain-containing protein [Schizosaccharomyces pombe]